MRYRIGARCASEHHPPEQPFTAHSLPAPPTCVLFCFFQALEADVHVVGVSTQAAGHKTLVPALIEELKRLAAEAGGVPPKVVVGGVIPEEDFKPLYEAGVVAIFGNPAPPEP